MKTRGIFEPGPSGPRAAILRDARLVELIEPPLAGEDVTDEIFLARVTGVDPRMNAAFLDLGDGREGFLVAKDARHLAAAGRDLPIQRLVHEGQHLLVQGVREADADKRARFTAELRLFGMLLIHRPLASAAGAPERARGRRREELAERARQLFPEGDFVLRRSAANADDDSLRAEAERLRARFARIRDEAAGRRRPGQLDTGEPVVERLLRRVLEEAPDELVVADAALAAALGQLVGQLPAPLRPQLRRLPDGTDAFAATGVRAQIDEALVPVVALAGGGRIVIEPTLACVTIDVDGYGRSALEIDLEAAAEIGRQLRLRNLGGTIVVDFLDLARPADRRRLEEALKKAVRDDPASVQVHPMSPLGIVQLSRARRGRPLAARWRRPCRRCGADSREPSCEAAAERLFAELRVRRAPPRRVRASPELVAWLKRRHPTWLAGTELVAEAGLHGNQFVVEEAA